MFNFNNLPTWGKWIAGILIGLFVTFGIVQIDNILPSAESNKSVERIEVKFEVRTEEENPIKDVRVQFTFNNAPEVKYTDSLGFVTINIPARKDIEITLSKKGFETYRRILNLEAEPDRTRIIRLLQKENLEQSSLIDYQYITAQNSFFPLIFSFIRPNLNIKIVKNIFSDVLGIENSTPLIYNNEVYRNIENFKLESSKSKLLSEDLSQITFQASKDKFYEKELADAPLIKAYYYDSDSVKEIESYSDIKDLLQDGEQLFCEYIFAPVINPFQNSIDNAQYTSFLGQLEKANFPQNLNELESVIYGRIWQFPKLSSIKISSSKDVLNLHCNSKTKNTWIEKIIKNNPEHHGLIGFEYSYILNKEDYFDNPGCGGILWFLHRYTPSPYIKFIDIKNNSKQSVRINSIKYQIKENNPYKINTADLRNQVFKDVQKTNNNIGISLKPNEHFFIPIEFGFNTQSYKKRIDELASYPIDSDNFNSLNKIFISKAFSESEMAKFYDNRDDYGDLSPTILNDLSPIVEVDISDEFKKKSSYLENILSLIPDRLSIGQLINVNSITINNKEINLALPSNEPTTITIAASVQYGSCPYLVVFDGKKWLEMGTILSNINKENLQETEIYSLGKNISKLKLEERESEISYIDMISILYVNSETKATEEIVYPLTELQKVDKNYYLLHQGESLDIDLEKFIPDNAYDLKLKVNGYFKAI